MSVILIVILSLLALCAILTTHQDHRVKKLKEMYTAFREKLPSKYDFLKNKKTIITGRFSNGSPGENVNKGEEITVCIDGDDMNSMFHILIHEIAHSTVKEYDHSSEFWDNYKELTDIATREGFYTPGVNKEYCGKMIHDGFSST